MKKNNFWKLIKPWHMVITFVAAIATIFFIGKDRIFTKNDLNEKSHQPILIEDYDSVKQKEIHNSEKGGINKVEIGNKNRIDSTKIKNTNSTREGVNTVKIGDGNKINGLEIEQEN